MFPINSAASMGGNGGEATDQASETSSEGKNLTVEAIATGGKGGLSNVKMDRFSPPHFFHIAEPSNLASIKRHGLLSTERLIRRTIRGKKEVDALLVRHRHEPLVLGDGTVVRDQKPMPPSLLAPALRDGMAPSDWYRLVNGFVFLWANEARVRGAFESLPRQAPDHLTIRRPAVACRLGASGLAEPH